MNVFARLLAAVNRQHPVSCEPESPYRALNLTYCLSFPLDSEEEARDFLRQNEISYEWVVYDTATHEPLRMIIA